MNYKKILPSRNMRIKLLSLMDFVPDKMMIRIQYRLSTGNRLNLNNPKRFTEKLQWYKLYYRNPVMVQCVDKINVREYVIEKGLEDILIPLYSIYSNPEEIDFCNLPEQFVLKTTNGGGNNNVLICKQKELLDVKKTKDTLKKWLNSWTGKLGREWVYYNIEPRILCEKYLLPNNNEDLIDYKFVCFNGKVEYIFVNSERKSSQGITFGIYDRDFKKLPYGRKGLRGNTYEVPKPFNFNKMISIAERLSSDFPHVRVDLYNLDGHIYFGELTFFHGSGYIVFDPDNFDFILGEKFNL